MEPGDLVRGKSSCLSLPRGAGRRGGGIRSRGGRPLSSAVIAFHFVVSTARRGSSRCRRESRAWRAARRTGCAAGRTGALPARAESNLPFCIRCYRAPVSSDPVPVPAAVSRCSLTPTISNHECGQCKPADSKISLFPSRISAPSNGHPRTRLHQHRSCVIPHSSETAAHSLQSSQSSSPFHRISLSPLARLPSSPTLQDRSPGTNDTLHFIEPARRSVAVSLAPFTVHP